MGVPFFFSFFFFKNLNQDQLNPDVKYLLGLTNYIFLFAVRW